MYRQLKVCIYAAVLLVMCQLTVAQVPFPRGCPEVKVPTEFNADAYMGTWYEYAKYPHIFEIAKRCMSARYSNKGNNTIGVVNTSINTITGHITNTTGVARLLAPSQINVIFSKFPNSADIPNYIVLGTDYKTYSVVYSCNNITSFAHTKLLWIMTRERKPSDEAVNTAKKIMDDNNLPQTFLLVADQDNCPDVASGYGINISFGDSSNNNIANKINKGTVATVVSPTPTEIDILEATVETTANVIELA